jgi:hypothetical protein
MSYYYFRAKKKKKKKKKKKRARAVFSKCREIVRTNLEEEFSKRRADITYVYVDICIYLCMKLITRVTIKPLGEKTHLFFFFFFFEVIYLIITCCCTPACSLSLPRALERAPASSRLLVSFSERLGRLWKLSVSLSLSIVRARSLGFSRHGFLFDWIDRFARVRSPRRARLLLLRLHRRLRRR